MANQANNFDHLFTPYYSTNYTQKYLQKAYIRLNTAKADVYSYDNCNKFISYIENGLLYFKQLDCIPIQLKPLLLYYGFTHFLKACLLIVDPLYPQTTAVLSHGVSTRKKKKQQYEFLYDEIKVQRHGLFAHTAEKLFNINHLENEKIAMVDLLMELPELGPIFNKIKNKRTCVEVQFNEQHTVAYIPEYVLDHYKMTTDRFKEHIKSKWDIPILAVQQDGKMLSLHFEHVYKPIHGNLPFRLNIQTGKHYLSLQKEGLTTSLPDILILYLLLYNLSMISRYETEWWSDLFKEMPFYDLPFIHSLLKIAERKVPLLITEWLENI